MKINLRIDQSRRLYFPSTMLFGEKIDLQISGTSITASPEYTYTIVTTKTGIPVAVAGPFDETWTANISLATVELSNVLKPLDFNDRLRCWAGVFDGNLGTFLGVGDAVIQNSPFAPLLENVPELNSPFVLKADLEGVDIDRPTSITALADTLAEMISKLRGL